MTKDQLIHAMDLLKLNNSGLGQMCGVSRKAVWEWVNGIHPVPGYVDGILAPKLRHMTGIKQVVKIDAKSIRDNQCLGTSRPVIALESAQGEQAGQTAIIRLHGEEVARFTYEDGISFETSCLEIEVQ